MRGVPSCLVTTTTLLAHGEADSLGLSLQTLFDWSGIGGVYLMLYQRPCPQVVLMVGKHILVLMEQLNRLETLLDAEFTRQGVDH